MIVLQACATIPIFSPRVMEGVDEGFEVAVWWATPNAVTGRKVELGGRVVRADVKNGETILVVMHLPIVDQLVYESFERHRRMEHYGIFYRATIDPKWLVAGNHIIVIGVTAPAKSALVSGTHQIIPFITAECLHVWDSAGTPTPALPLATAERFASLKQATYCTSGY